MKTTRPIHKQSLKHQPNNYVKFIGYILSIVIWIVIWHIAAKQIDNSLFLPSPGEVFTVLFDDLITSGDFITSLITSLGHIGMGFIIGAILGILMAVLSSSSYVFRTFVWFPVKIFKSVPVASFVILVLLWLDAEDLSIFIPAIIVLPTLYINTLTGIEQTSDKLLNMADLFKVSRLRRIAYIYIPEITPHVLSGCSLAVGMAWKAGIAAEIIGLAGNTIGNKLYQTKIHLMTAELFAWTIVVVLLSIICETVIKGLIRLLDRQ